MFRRISYRLALQFTAFVLGLLLVNGALFFVADFSNARRVAHDRLERSSRAIVERMLTSGPNSPLMPPHLRERVRIVDIEGKPVFTGGLFSDEPFTPMAGFNEMKIQNEEYIVHTVPILRDGETIAYAQVADIERIPLGDLPFRALMYILVSLGISILTFGVGLFFARRNLRPAEQMLARLEQFTQDASHELRTPLAALSSSLDLALKTKDYRSGIESARDDVKHVSIVVERLLDLARLDTFVLTTERTDLSALASSVVEKHTHLAKEHGITLRAKIAKNIFIDADAALLRQAISNLITNAIKFTKRRGTVHVTLTETSISVQDTGIGIAPDALPHIFERFYQADPSRSNGGCGLGLALVKRIADLHGWTIGVQSKLSKGSTFTIRFGKSSS